MKYVAWARTRYQDSSADASVEFCDSIEEALKWLEGQFTGTNDHNVEVALFELGRQIPLQQHEEVTEEKVIVKKVRRIKA